MWCFVAARTTLRTLFVICLAVATLYAVAPVRAAQDTTVQAAICGAGSSAQLTIDSPPSDSTVNQPTVQVSGTVGNASQIEVSIDGNYDSIVPLGAGQTSYSTTVTLTGGTHTITLVANDICQMQNATESVVVTYHPQSVPGSGSETPTNVPDGVRVGGEPIDSARNPIEASSVPVVGPVIDLIHDLAKSLDFEVETQSGTLFRSTLRFSFIVFGIALATLGNMGIVALGWLHGPLPGYWRWGTRIVGGLLIIAAFLI